MAKANDRREIGLAIAQKYGMSRKQAERFVQTFFEVINDGLHHDKLVKVKGLGTFKVIDVKERESVNIRTGERFMIEGREKITFTPDAVMKELVNKPFSQFETVVVNDGVDFSEIDAAHRADVTYTETEDVASSDSLEETQTPISPAHISPLADILTDEESEAPAMTVEPVVEKIDDPLDFSDNETNEENKENKHNEDAYEDKEEEGISINNKENEEEIEENSVDEVLKETMEESEVEEKDNDNDHLEEDTDMEENSSIWSKLLAFVIVAALAFGVGYWLGNRLSPQKYIPVGSSEVIEGLAHDSIMTDSTTINDSIMKAKDAIIKAKVDSVTRLNEARNDSIRARAKKIIDEKAQAEADAKKSTPVTPMTSKPEQSKVVEEQPKANDAQVLAQARSIMTHGAYNIVGTAQTITVKKGQTMKCISKTYLGSEMACYIQCHNNVAEVTEGMQLRIPKLELKKKK